jgi:aldehyde dehydrogenase (NAD+)
VAACGGKADPELGGFFVQPTVLTNVRPEMRVMREEVFGPVVGMMAFDTEDEGVAIANDTRYGLAAGIWTNDIRRVHRVAKRLQTGTVWVNSYRAAAPSVPFGGQKASGIGRENGINSINEFTETKAIWVELSGERRDPFRIG